MATDKSLLWKLAHALQAQKGYPIGAAIKDAKILLESDKNQARELIKANEQRIKAAKEAEKAAKKAAREAIAAEKKAEKQRIKAAREAEKAEKQAAINRKKAEVKEAKQEVQAARKGKKLLKPKRGRGTSDIFPANYVPDRITKGYMQQGIYIDVDYYGDFETILDEYRDFEYQWVTIKNNLYPNERVGKATEKNDTIYAPDIDVLNDYLVRKYKVYLKKPTDAEIKNNTYGMYTKPDRGDKVFVMLPATGKIEKYKSLDASLLSNKLEGRFDRMLADSEKSFKATRSTIEYKFNEGRSIGEKKDIWKWWIKEITGIDANDDPKSKNIHEHYRIDGKKGWFGGATLKPGVFYLISKGYPNTSKYYEVAGGKVILADADKVIQSFR